MRRQSMFGLWLWLTWIPARAQPPDPLPLEERPRTREAMIGWIREQAQEGDSHCTLTLGDGSVLQGELETLPGGPNVSLRTDPAAPPRPVLLEKVVQAQFRDLVPLPLLPPAKVQFRDGSWMLGVEVARLDEQSLRFSTPYAEDLEVPVGAVAEMQFAEVTPANAPPEQVPILWMGGQEGGETVKGDRLVEGQPRIVVEGQPLRPLTPHGTRSPQPVEGQPLRALPQTPPPDQNTGRLWLTNGDVMSGQPVAIADGSLTFRLRLGPEVQVPLGDVKRLSLPPQPWTPPATSPEKVSGRVTLITGEVWLGTIEKLDAQGLQLGWFGGQSVLLPGGLLHALTDLEQGVLGMRQWAVAATASSEYGNPQWSARQATGPPNTLQDGDYSTAWATRAQDGGPEWLELEYATPVHATRVRVRETYNPGAVVRIEGVSAEEPQVAVLTLWEGHDPTRQSPGWLEARFEPTQTLISKVRVHLDTALVPGWNEIDAVELIGTP